MSDITKNEFKVYLEKINFNSVKEKWIIKNLPNLYQFIIDKPGFSISEKIYLLSNKVVFCKICDGKTKFLSYKRGYRIYCSKKCSNSDFDLCEKKLKAYKEKCLIKYGFDNSSKSEVVKLKLKESKKNIDYDNIYEKAKITNLIKYDVDNPSKSEFIKYKKRITTQINWGVDNPFQSSEIKEKIKVTNIEKYGFYHPAISDEIKNKIRKTNLKKYGSNNYKSSEFDKIGTLLKKDPQYLKYINKSTYLMICNQGHNYEIKYDVYYYRKKLNIKTCTVCYPIDELVSIKEKEVFSFVASIYKGKIISSYRDKLEIDIYLPELKIGFEFNGLYWHSELFKDKNYHLNKTNHFKNKDIRIIHIWEDDWIFKQEIVKSQIKNIIGITNNKIYARKCEIREIKSPLILKEFLNNNHIQGYVHSVIKLGLYCNNELVSLMTFDKFEGRKKMGENEWNLSRFCNVLNTNVIGGASKLLNYFIKNYNTSRIISFADKSWSNGELYYKLGFSLKNISYPNYSYFLDKKRVNKQKYKKSNLIKMGFDKNKSESKIMEDEFGSYKIFDCGQLKFEVICTIKS
jgi:hypothetical protein